MNKPIITFNFKEFIDTALLTGGVVLIAGGLSADILVMAIVGGVLLGVWNGRRQAGL